MLSIHPPATHSLSSANECPEAVKQTGACMGRVHKICTILLPCCQMFARPTGNKNWVEYTTRFSATHAPVSPCQQIYTRATATALHSTAYDSKRVVGVRVITVTSIDDVKQLSSTRTIDSTNEQGSKNLAATAQFPARAIEIFLGMILNTSTI